MSDTPNMLTKLKETRAGFKDERSWHRLMLDAYSGGGGFMGAVIQPVSGFWGSAAEVYATNSELFDSSAEISKLTYLDRFPRESVEKFRRRVHAAHYPNYVGPLTDLKLSFMMRKPMSAEGRPQEVEDWRTDVDGRGTKWRDLERDIALRAATVGWLPVVVDLPPSPRDEEGNVVSITKARSNELGIRPRVIPLFPANLLDYQCDEQGVFMWAKIQTDRVDQPDAFDEKEKVSTITVWYPDSFLKYEIREQGTAQPQLIDAGMHPFGEVPIAVLQHKPSPDDPVKGIAMHGQEAVEGRALFNRQSELDEHMRGQVFAILVLAAQENEKVGEVLAGTDNGIFLDPDSGQKHYFLSPDASVAESYEKRLEVTVQEMYRQARVEFTRPTASRTAVSGIARKFEFAQTDRALSDFAEQLAKFNVKIDTLVAKGLGLSDDAVNDLRITPPSSFDVEDLQSDMDIAISAISNLHIGGTAEKKLRMRIINQLLPNLSEEDKNTVESEVDAILDAQANEQAMLERQTFGEPVQAAE